MSLLKNLQPTNIIKPPFGLMYGGPGIGKSTFAAAIPKNLFFDCNDGLDGILSTKFPIRPGTRNEYLFQTFQEIMTALDVVHREEHDFTTLTLDTISDIEKIIHAQVCAERNIPTIEDINYGKAYHFAMKHWEKLIKKLEEIRRDRRMMILFLGHSVIKRYDDPMTEGYDRHTIDIHQKTIMPYLERKLDLILFADQKTFTSKQDVGFNKKITKVTGGIRVMFTREDPRFTAKNRYGLPFELPLDYGQFIEIFKNSATANYKETLAQEAKELAEADALMAGYTQDQVVVKA